MRTRSKIKEITMNISKLQLVTPETPETGPAELPRTPEVSSSEDDDDDDDNSMEEEPPLDTHITPASQVSEELQNQMFPPTKDEQIVNSAFVVFLNALTIHFDVSRTCNWTMHRKGFKTKFERAEFKAYTDGYLDNGQEDPFALIEVKPVIRHKHSEIIQMQESAQMIGWIMNDANNSVSNDKLRIHLSQDRHQIFITLATYDADYLAYLKGESPTSESPSFLTMNQYGPWDTQDIASMRSLGPILLAITLYADAEIRETQQRLRR